MISLASDILALLPTALAPIAVGWGLMIFLRGFRRPRVTLDEQGIDRQPRWAKELGRLTSGWAGLRLGPLVAILGLGLGLLGIFVFPRYRPLLKSPPADPHLANLLEVGYFEWLGVGTVCFGHSLLAYALWSHRSWGVPRCAKCAYPMASIASGVCPECGREHRGMRQLTKPRLLRRALIASILVMLAWPVLAVGVQTKQRYDAQGRYGLIPDWVMVAGMWRLPDDMILGTDGLQAAYQHTSGSLAWRIENAEYSYARVTPSIRAKTARKIASAIRNKQESPTKQRRAVLLAESVIHYNSDRRAILPPELQNDLSLRELERLTIDLLLDSIANEENFYSTHYGYLNALLGGWTASTAATDEELVHLAMVSLTNTQFSRSASHVLLRAMDRRHIFEPVFLDWYAKAEHQRRVRGIVSHIVEGRLAAESEVFADLVFKMSRSISDNARAKALWIFGSWNRNTSENQQLPIHIRDQLIAGIKDPSPLVVRDAIFLTDRWYPKDEWLPRIARVTFLAMDTAALPEVKSMQWPTVLHYLCNDMAWSTERDPEVRLVRIESMLRFEATQISSQRTSGDWEARRLVNDPDSRVRALAQLYLDTDWDTVPADHREWLPQAIERALQQAESDAGEP